MFNVGDRVIYVSGAHGKDRHNPLRGTSYFCTGTIYSKMNGDVLPLKVRWDNGTRNSYYESDLQKLVYLDEGLFEL